jgi:endonuclease III
MRMTKKRVFADMVFASMASARIHGASAERGARAILEKWRTPEDLIQARYDDVRATLTDNGYARYDIQRAGWLLMMARQLVEQGSPKAAEDVTRKHGCGPTTVKILREECGWDI